MKTVAVVNLIPNTDKEALLIVEALQLYAIFAEGSGIGRAPTLSLAPGKDAPAEADAVLVLAEHSDAAGDAGYHFLGDDGRPMMRAFLDGTESNEILRDVKDEGDSLLANAQHELVETMGDEPANLYVSEKWISPDGITWSLRAKEHSDPVQGQCQITTLKDGTMVDCANFVLNAYFNPRSPKGTKLDAMGLLKTPGELAPQGYQIAARITDEKSILASAVMSQGGGPPATAWRAKLHPSSRTSRRVRALQAVLSR